MWKLRRLFQRKIPECLLRIPNIPMSGSTMPGQESPVDALLKLGYAFNQKGELKQVVDGSTGPEPFQFRISEIDQECQANYENIGAVVTDYVYQLLETQEHLTRLPVPRGSEPAAGTFIFGSRGYGSQDTLVLLVHGSGVVRAGQWARSLIINENLDKGTQIPYIRKALSKNYGVLVLNTNDNYRNDETIPKSGTPDEHAQYVWDTYVAQTKATFILIVAHSYGGVVVMNLAKNNKKDFKRRVKAVALTDSVHGYSCKSPPSHVLEIAKNWVSSEKPLDTPVPCREQDIPMVSAGHIKHEMTSYSCMDSVFKFFEEKLAKN